MKLVVRYVRFSERALICRAIQSEDSSVNGAYFTRMAYFFGLVHRGIEVFNAHSVLGAS